MENSYSDQLTPDLDRSLVPLVLGVVGHRDPREEALPSLRKNFIRFLESLTRSLPNTPLWMLNGLAIGMDSLAAEIFLDVAVASNSERPQELHHQLLGALPMYPERYRGDFTTAEDLDRFDTLLRRCHSVLHPGNCPGLRGLAPLGEELPVPDCYAQQGVFMVRHSYLVAAFFNGVDSLEAGGTGQSVAMQKGEVHPLFLSVDEVIASREPGALVEFDTPRRKNSFPAPRPNVTYWLESKKAQDLEGLLPIPFVIDKVNSNLLANPVAPAEWAPFSSLLWSYADSESVRMKKNFIIICQRLAVVGLLVSLLISQPSTQPVGLLLIFFAILYFPNAQRRPRQEFISNRCLAEALTIQQYWHELGIEDDVADLFNTQATTDLSWIRTVLRARHVQLITCLHDRCNSVDTVITARRIFGWVNQQIHWYQATIKRHEHASRKLLSIAGVCASFAFILTALVFLYELTGAWPVIAEVLIASFLSAVAFRELMGYQDINARYARSKDQFERGLLAFRRALEQPSDSNRLVRLRIALEAIGREKIDELNDWVSGQLKRSYKPGS